MTLHTDALRWLSGIEAKLKVRIQRKQTTADVKTIDNVGFTVHYTNDDKPRVTYWKLENIHFISKLHNDRMAGIQQTACQNACKNSAIRRRLRMQISDAILPAKCC